MELTNMEQLLDFMTEPSEVLVREVGRLKGDLMILGAGGKVGTSLAIKARRAMTAAGAAGRVLAVSLFDYADGPRRLQQAGVEVIEADVSDPEQLAALPEAENIIYMIGKKFGTTGNEANTAYINIILPHLIAQRFPRSRIVAFSTGNVYGDAPLYSGGSTEEDIPCPVGEYAQTCLARERVFEYCSRKNNTPMLMFRLNYAIDLRYGVLCDIARNILEGTPVSLDAGVFNCVWQGEVCEYAIRSLLLTTVPPRVMNVSSPEVYSIRWAARELGKRLGKEPIFSGQEGSRAMFTNNQKLSSLLGAPQVSILQMMDWVAAWMLRGGEAIAAPTHFEATDGKF